MKIRFVALMAITLATVALMTSCNKASNTANSNSTANTGGTPTASPSATVGSLPTPNSSPTTPASASTPTEAFRSYYEAIKRNDAEAVKALFSKATLDALRKEASQKNKAFDDIFKEGLEGASKEIPPTLPETRNEKIEGDKATLEVKDEKKGSWDTLKFVNEDGQWKLAFADADAR